MALADILRSVTSGRLYHENAAKLKAAGYKVPSIPEMQFNASLAFGGPGGNAHLVSGGHISNVTGELDAVGKAAKKDYVDTQVNNALFFIGTAGPGEGKKRRGEAARAQAVVNSLDLTGIPSSGGFSILGKNAFGEDIARDNATGSVRPVSGFIPISPTARTLGEAKGGKALALQDNVRRKERDKSRRRSKGGAPRSGVGSSGILTTEETILGSQSILG